MGKADIPDVVLPDTLLTSHQVAAMLQVNPSSIGNWVSSGRLKAFRTPGGHRRIRGRDLVAFLESHELPIPPSLVRAMRRRVLWLEEDGGRRAELERALLPHEDTVEAIFVGSIPDALLEAGFCRPHLVVLSVGDDTQPALDACERLKGHAQAGASDVLFASTAHTDALVAAARKAGAKDCIAAPVSLDAVLAALQGK